MKPTIGKTWCKRGSTTPKAPIRPGYKNFYLYSAVDPFSGHHFTLLLPWVYTDLMSMYLQELADAYPNETLWVILDRAGWHASGTLKIPPSIHLVPLPPYSPELNPVERLWRWLRRHVCRNRLFETYEEFEETVLDAINNLTDSFLASLCRCSYLNNIN